MNVAEQATVSCKVETGFTATNSISEKESSVRQAYKYKMDKVDTTNKDPEDRNKNNEEQSVEQNNSAPSYEDDADDDDEEIYDDEDSYIYFEEDYEDEEESPRSVQHFQNQEPVNPTAKALSTKAQNATTSSTRRVLSDMHKVMITKGLPFSVEQEDKDRMDKWVVKLNVFDKESDLWKDLRVLGLDYVELSMDFPKDYPFAPPFVQVVRPRFAKGTGYVINGAICMELLSPDGWNPINSVESVIVSIQSHLVIGRGRLAAAKELGDQKRNLLLKKLIYDEEDGGGHDNEASTSNGSPCKRKSGEMALDKENNSQVLDAGEYSVAEAKLYFKRIVSSHERTGWSNGSVERG